MFVHIDIDSFFVSAERARDHSLCAVPVAVGGRSDLKIFKKGYAVTKVMNLNGGAFVAPVFHSTKEKRSFERHFVERNEKGTKIRGIVTTASYEARAKGVETGMPLARALRLCPEMKVLPADLLYYHRLSHELYLFLSSCIPKTEQYSIDEFFGDLDGWVDMDEAVAFAKRLQQEILERFFLPVSIGIAKSKWTAKLATGYAKPYGILMIEDIEDFIQDIPVAAFPGVGRGYAKRLKALGIERLGEVASQKRLFSRWGKSGERLYKRILGIDAERIEPGKSRQSIGMSRTFDPLRNKEEIRRRVMIMARHISWIALEMGVNPTLYLLRLRCSGGERLKAGRRVERVFSEFLFKKTLSDILEEILVGSCGVVKISLSVSDFVSIRPRTLSMLSLEKDMLFARLGEAVHSARARFGLDMIKTGSEI